MQNQLFYQFILRNQSITQSTHKELTLDKIFDVLLKKIQSQYQSEPMFMHQFFKGSLRKVTQIIMNTVYRHQLPFVKSEQIVTVVGIVQHIAYSKSIDLPKPIIERLTKYIHLLVVLQSIENMRTIFEDTRNLSFCHNYYFQVYRSAYLNRVHNISSMYGLRLSSNDLPLYVLKFLVEQKQGNIQKYQSIVTSQWITLSLIYLALTVKSDLYKQKPVLARILQKYNQSSQKWECRRQINGDQLCNFYNEAFLGVMIKLDEKQFQCMFDQIKIDVDVIAQYVVSLIHNENNTVLDNIIFSVSWDP